MISLYAPKAAAQAEVLRMLPSDAAQRSLRADRSLADVVVPSFEEDAGARAAQTESEEERASLSNTVELQCNPEDLEVA